MWTDYPVNPESILEWLFGQGHFHKSIGGFVTEKAEWDTVTGLPSDCSMVQDAIASWQSYRPDLLVDGLFGPKATAHAKAETRRCGCPDIMSRRSGALANKWPPDCQKLVTMATALDGLDFSGDPKNRTVRDAIDKAITMVNAACGIHVEHIDDWATAKIRSAAGRVGAGILAWSELAYGRCDAQLAQRFGQSIKWEWQLLWTTKLHEDIHAYGIGHTQQVGNIMTPYHSWEVTKLGPWDLMQLVNRYGKAEVDDGGGGGDDDDDDDADVVGGRKIGKIIWRDGSTPHDVLLGAEVP